MAFLKIARGSRITKVSRSQYENIYKKLGYRIIEEYNSELTNEENEEPEEETENEAEEDIESIPISEMTKEQLAAYALKHNIDTKGARNVSEARRIIQRANRESKM